MCAVHTLWDGFLAGVPDGSKPWARVSASSARLRLRRVLGALSVPNAQRYGTQDFRRGHAEASHLLLHICLCWCVSALFAGYEEVRVLLVGDTRGGTVAVFRLHEVHK